MRSLIYILSALGYVCIAVGRPHSSVAETPLDGSRESRTQNPLDASEPLEISQKVHPLHPYTTGGKIPVQLVYGDESNEESNEAQNKGSNEKTVANREERSNERLFKDQDESRTKQSEEVKDVEPNKEKQQDETDKIETTEANIVPAVYTSSVEPSVPKPSLYRSRLLNLDVRESDDNAKYGLEIQSRNKNPPVADTDSYIYNVLPYHNNEYHHINIEDYINKLKNEKLNKKKPAAVTEPPTVDEENDEEGESEVDEQRPIRRRIQHYETVIKPMNQLQSLMQPYSQNSFPGYPLMNGMLNTQGYNTAPTVLFLPMSESSSTKNLERKPYSSRIFDSYFPFVINNPFNEIWSGITNIVEYGPEADVCRKGGKKGRRHDSNIPAEIEITSPRNSESDTFPHITKMKVRRGGVAIAGPGGIATAGSGGTAIVGPGGTAYTTRRGTAVVGPGGKVVHVPEFPVFHSSGDKTEPRHFDLDLQGEVVARGPVVYYDDSNYD